MTVDASEIAKAEGGPGPVGVPAPDGRTVLTIRRGEEHHSDMDVTPRCFRHQWQATAATTVCIVCGRVRDEAVKRRNRQNKNRGGAFERSIATKLGARRTGPLGGRDDVLGETVVVQTKKTINFSVRQARAYLDDLSLLYPTRTALVIHAEPGRDREAVVILSLNDWLALHGPDGMEKSA